MEHVESEFKNFHRLLCERFGYTHDEQDWKRDQLSLIEHIGSLQAVRPRFKDEGELIEWLDCLYTCDEGGIAGSEKWKPAQTAIAALKS